MNLSDVRRLPKSFAFVGLLIGIIAAMQACGGGGSNAPAPGATLNPQTCIGNVCTTPVTQDFKSRFFARCKARDLFPIRGVPVCRTQLNPTFKMPNNGGTLFITPYHLFAGDALFDSKRLQPRRSSAGYFVRAEQTSTGLSDQIALGASYIVPSDGQLLIGLTRSRDRHDHDASLCVSISITHCIDANGNSYQCSH